MNWTVFFILFGTPIIFKDILYDVCWFSPCHTISISVSCGI